MRRGFLLSSEGQPSGKPGVSTQSSTQSRCGADRSFDDLLAACTTLPEYEDFVRDAANATKREKKSAADARRMRKRLRERMAYVLSQASADATLLEALGPLTAARAGVGSSSGTEGGLTNEDSMEVDSRPPPSAPSALIDPLQPSMDPPPPVQPPLTTPAPLPPLPHPPLSQPPSFFPSLTPPPLVPPPFAPPPLPRPPAISIHMWTPSTPFVYGVHAQRFDK